MPLIPQLFLNGGSLDLLGHWLQFPLGYTLYRVIHCIGQRVFREDAVVAWLPQLAKAHVSQKPRIGRCCLHQLLLPWQLLSWDIQLLNLVMAINTSCDTKLINCAPCEEGCPFSILNLLLISFSECSQILVSWKKGKRIYYIFLYLVFLILIQYYNQHSMEKNSMEFRPAFLNVLCWLDCAIISPILWLYNIHLDMLWMSSVVSIIFKGISILSILELTYLQKVFFYEKWIWQWIE